MLTDGLFDRLVHRFRRSRCEESNESSLSPNGERADPRNSRSGQHGSGFFNNANRFVINRPTFVEHRGNIINNFVAGTPEYHPVLERIAQYANLDSAADSSARFPPPTCHPGTRLKIGDKLFTWLANPGRERDIIWLYGPAGTGKSAVAQSLTEVCAEIGRLGASFFFSRPNDRNDPNTVIPTLVYQLAVCLPHYKSLVTAQLANDPELLRKTRRTQFKKLIIEPLSQLQTQKRKRIREPLLVVLDGLDECKDENAQREIVEMIGEVVRVKKDFPLVWLICSRPELHLKYLFSRTDFTVACGQEELAIDAASIADVDFYLRDGLAGIKADFPYVTSPTWPPEGQAAELSQKASGHFGFASISLRYIGDATHSAPMSRLNNLLSFLKGVRTGESNPLEALDALYSAIFRDVPEDVLPATKQVLTFIFLQDGLHSAQGLCNFLHIDQTTFYNAFRKLCSVIDLPSPEAASQRQLRFYHTSLVDYLLDPSRSGKFAFNMPDADLNYAKLCLSWYKTDLELFHATDGPIFNKSHKHGILPGLLWVSGDNREEISRKVAEEAGTWCWPSCVVSKEWDEALLSQIRNFDFRYIRTDNPQHSWYKFVNKLWERDPSSGIIRTEPRTEGDILLLEYMKSVVGPLWRGVPVTFPLKDKPNEDGHFFLGYGSKAVIWWSGKSDYCMLNSDEPPSKERIDAYWARIKSDE